jgi:hypothetical protein
MKIPRWWSAPRQIAGALALAAASALSFSAHAVGTLADIQVFDRTAGRQLPLYWHEGRPYVVGRPGNEYQIVARSRSGEDLLAVVSVDGVHVVSGQTASPHQGGYVLAPGERTSIRGWRKNLGETAAFYFTSLGDSYAARTDRPDNVGVIGVALFQRARYYEAPEEVVPESPWYEKRGKAESGAPSPKSGRTQVPSAPLGTGHGRREDSFARPADFERATDEPVETIAIYYDSSRNLVARGVLPAYGQGRRDPDPFPRGFTPDPGYRRY